MNFCRFPLVDKRRFSDFRHLPRHLEISEVVNSKAGGNSRREFPLREPLQRSRHWDNRRGGGGIFRQRRIVHRHFLLDQLHLLLVGACGREDFAGAEVVPEGVAVDGTGLPPGHEGLHFLRREHRDRSKMKLCNDCYRASLREFHQSLTRFSL